jgi:nitroreductase
MEFKSLLKKRKSVRSFKNKSVSWKDALEVVDAATLVPAAGGKNPFKYIIVENPTSIAKLAKASDQDWIADTSIVIAVTSDDAILEKLFGPRGRIFSRQQAGAAIQNMLLRATDIGLSSCWVGSYSDTKVRDTLKIPKSSQIEALIPLGYEQPKRSASKIKKRDLETFLRWEDHDTKKRSYPKEPGIFRNR